MAENNSPPETQVTITNVSNSNEENENELPIESGTTDDASLIEQSEAGLNGGDGTASASGESDTVAITRIESERDIAIASIHADVELERIEANTEALIVETETKSEIEQCREELQSLREQVERLAISLTPPPLLVEETPVEVVLETPSEQISTEQSLTPISTVTPTPSIVTEVLDENVEEELEAGLTRARRKFIAI